MMMTKMQIELCHKGNKKYSPEIENLKYIRVEGEDIKEVI